MPDIIDIEDFIDLDEKSLDCEEIANEEINYLIRSTEASSDIGGTSLKKKVQAFPSLDFPVSDYSSYKDDIWNLEYPTGRPPARIHFCNMVPDSIELSRALLYYSIPDFCPTGIIKSYASTQSRSMLARLLYQYVVEDNKLLLGDEGIQCITPVLLNTALDKAKEKSPGFHYRSVYTMLRLWSNLSKEGLIPEHLCLEIDLELVDTKERRSDVRKSFEGSIQSWIPYSNRDIEEFITYALFWLEKGIPSLKLVREYLDEVPLDLSQRSKGEIYVSQGFDSSFEQAMDVVVDDVRIMGCKATPRRHGGWVEYRWKSIYAASLDHIRDSIFIMVAMLLGMRSRELCQLTLDDIYPDDSGNYWVDITRFKTTKDPNFHGKTETMPCPQFVGKCVEQYKYLKSIAGFEKENYLFQSNQSRKVVNNFTGSNLKIITGRIADHLNIDRIHAHRFRKTTAEILINRSEYNIDLIRMLFGHESYSMTLKYIARNPFMVRQVAEAIEVNLTEGFHELIQNIKRDSYSGKPADRLANAMIDHPEKFKGKKLKLQLLNYVSHLLSSGEVVLISRTALGSYCLFSCHIMPDKQLPCLEGRLVTGQNLPDVSNCQLHCDHCVVVRETTKAITRNIAFYEALLDSEGLGVRAEKVLRQKLFFNERHLENLANNEHKVKKVFDCFNTEAL
ncbi:tyrosine-type recombinase/integrase [Halomonas sp. KRD171]|uniref:tyrosine-type recombinase/integrase n=1 Tax=Halomonas sp. KRD171 TaxID=2729726 RepID=UPI0019D02315